jgi:hypothetical protein
MDLKMLETTPPWEWPDNAAAIFQAILTDREASAVDRVLAAELAGDYVVINDQLAETLMGILGSTGESALLRSHAAISLGPALEGADTADFDDPFDDPPLSEEMFQKIQRFLHMLYQQEDIPKQVRRSIFEASVRAHQDWHADAIREAYASGDRDWTLTAVFGMAHVPGFEAEILESLKTSDPETHVRAVKAAGNWSLEAAWPHVFALVENAGVTPKPLLLAAIGAVASLRRDTATLELLHDLVDSEDEDISDAADEALSMAGVFDEFEEDDSEDDDASGWIN